MPINIPYTIVSCSGEDPGFPAAELLLHSQECQGWCTPRNCTYPQHLTLRLDRPATLHQIQVLSHEYKLAAKVEIQVAAPQPPSPAQDDSTAAAPFTRLGYLSFDANDRTKWGARELKSVTLGATEAALLRFVFHRCHSNALNAHNQVGLVMLNIVGEPLPPPSAPLPPAAVVATALHLPTPALPQLPTPAPPQPHPQPQAGPLADLAAELAVDAVTAQRINELQQQKAAAVAAEDYDEAKRLKGTVDRLRAAGGRIAALEAKKAAAVAAEDYDSAKSLKAEVERLRHRAYAALLRGGDGGGSMDAGTPLSPPRSRRPSSAGEEPSYALGAVGSHATPNAGGMVLGGNGTPHSGSATPLSGHTTSSSSGAVPAAAMSVGRVSVALEWPAGGAASDAGGSEWHSYDERPARARGAYDLANVDEFSPPPGVAISRRGSAVTASATAARCGGGNSTNDTATGPPPPAGFPAELPAPEALSGGDAKDAADLVALVEEHLARCVYSRTWQLREAGLAAIAADVGRAEGLPGLDGNADALRTLCRAVARGISDRVAAVSGAALGLLRALATAAPARRFPQRDMHAGVTELLPLLVERAADLNARSREQAVEVLIQLAGVKEVGLQHATAQLLRPLKRGENPKAALGRVGLVAQLLPVLGVALKPGGEGFSPSGIMEFACPALLNSSAEVRSAGVGLALQLAGVAGPGAVLPLLPRDLNPKVKEQLEGGLGARPPAVQVGAPPPAAHRRPSGGAGRKPSSAAEAPPAVPPPARRRSSAAAAATRPASAASRQQQPLRRSSQHQAAAAPQQENASRTDKPLPHPKSAGRRSPPGGQHIGAYRPADPSQQGLYGGASGGLAPGGPAAVLAAEMSAADPALYEDELRRREAQLGPTHPAVAEAATSLAMLYTQRGDPERALSLYHRSLAIWEAVHGPSSADVAHALTDIAVIHLEQGRDGEGRALLHRALHIQEALLGPTHPDVMAIRDVLED